MDADGMRAGDDDRRAVADRLKTALDEGRLDLSEYDSRVRRAYAATTYGELRRLVTDLPGGVPEQHAVVEPRGSASPAAMPRWIGAYAGVVAACVLVWAVASVASGELLYFWPVWMLFPFIVAIAARMRSGGR